MEGATSTTSASSFCDTVVIAIVKYYLPPSRPLQKVPKRGSLLVAPATSRHVMMPRIFKVIPTSPRHGSLLPSRGGSQLGYLFYFFDDLVFDPSLSTYWNPLWGSEQVGVCEGTFMKKVQEYMDSTFSRNTWADCGRLSGILWQNASILMSSCSFKKFDDQHRTCHDVARAGVLYPDERCGTFPCNCMMKPGVDVDGQVCIPLDAP